MKNYGRSHKKHPQLSSYCWATNCGTLQAVLCSSSQKPFKTSLKRDRFHHKLTCHKGGHPCAIRLTTVQWWYSKHWIVLFWRKSKARANLKNRRFDNIYSAVIVSSVSKSVQNWWWQLIYVVETSSFKNYRGFMFPPWAIFATYLSHSQVNSSFFHFRFSFVWNLTTNSLTQRCPESVFWDSDSNPAPNTKIRSQLWLL